MDTIKMKSQLSTRKMTCQIPGEGNRKSDTDSDPSKIAGALPGAAGPPAPGPQSRAPGKVQAAS